MDHRIILIRETNERFWHQTGYKPNQMLDPSNPNDRRMARVWLDIYARVSAEDKAGKLVTTTDPYRFWPRPEKQQTIDPYTFWPRPQ